MNIMMLAVSLYQGLFTGMETRIETLFRWVSLALSIPVVGYSALPIYQKGLGALKTGSLHIDLPITLGIVLSFLLSAWNTFAGSGEIYFDSLTTITFLLLATRYAQRRAFDIARERCASTWSLLPAVITEIKEDGTHQEFAIGELRAGMCLLVKPGERIPCDGLVQHGCSMIDCSTMTGESVATAVNKNSPVLAGTLNLESPLHVVASTGLGNSRLDRIVESITSSMTETPSLITSLDTLSMLFTASALCLAGGAFALSLPHGFTVATSAAIAMLTVTCPCAIALALPLLSIRALGAAAAGGVLVKSPCVFEDLSRVSRGFFDKTGTLTSGTLRLRHVNTFVADEVARDLTSHLVEIDSNHPTARALRVYTARRPRSRFLMLEAKRLPGRGVVATMLDSHSSTRVTAILSSLAHYRATSASRSPTQLDLEQFSSDVSVVTLTLDGELLAYFELSDAIPPEVTYAFEYLKRHLSCAILSGDRQEVTASIASQLGLAPEDSLGNLLPEQKAAHIAQEERETLFVGDGANDAAALRTASVGIALRGGIQSILESADVFITEGGVEKVVFLHRVASRYRRHSRLLVGLGVTYNLIGITAAFMGHVSPLIAAIAMPLFSSFVVLLAYTGFVGLQGSLKPATMANEGFL